MVYKGDDQWPRHNIKGTEYEEKTLSWETNLTRQNLAVLVGKQSLFMHKAGAEGHK